jgi:hypothetical protein
MSQRPPGSFTQATAPALPTSSSTATGKPGRFAASAFRPGYASHTTSGPGMRRALPRSMQPSMCWRRRRSSMSAAQGLGPLAEHDGLIYLDLADEFWRCIEIGTNGSRIAEDPPVNELPSQEAGVSRIHSSRMARLKLRTRSPPILGRRARPGLHGSRNPLAHAPKRLQSGAGGTRCKGLPPQIAAQVGRRQRPLRVVPRAPLRTSRSGPFDPPCR